MQIVDCGSIAAAARARRWTPKQVSRRLLQLEARVGKPLAHRSTRAFSPTDAGLQLYRAALEVLSRVDALSEALATDGPLSGRFTLALPTLAIEDALFDALAPLLRAHPRLELHVMATDRPVDPVAGGLDVVISASRPSASTLVTRRLFTLRAVLAAHRSYLEAAGTPRAPADLASHECLRFVDQHPQAVWSLEGPGGPAAVEVSGRFQSDDSRALRHAMAAGLGVGLCIPGDLRRFPDLVRVLPDYTHEPMAITLTYPAADRRSRAREVVLDALQPLFTAWEG